MSNMSWQPCIIEESHSGVREVALYTKHLMSRRIFLQGEIDADMANAVLSQILYLADDTESPIDIFINSEGGDVSSGLMIYDIIQSVKTPISIYCTGTAASMAAVILAGGQKGRRFMLPHAKTMLQKPVIAGAVGGYTAQRNASESLEETRRIVNGILAKHTGKTLEEIEHATKSGRYMSADESVAFGLCDAIKDELV
ncbi:MAG: ATP-dependent Clp protease proteolytic subunit [Bacteroidales bacterium]|nr:ATP-dependent Clp protease proteolytic subunit [Lachnoclostridium sp.]MCM1385620.1 ATP-dependent Clp protease proteolytic subunit [Lachnoclostridium sp.]MCM1466433.1 ATP-dependent Clp protease proteolytic subunit [Bacteroidales bacterium]